MTVRTTYTEEHIERALAVLAGHKGNVSRAARELGMPAMTLHQWASGKRRQPETEKAEASRKTAQSVTRLRLMRQWTILARSAIKQAQSTLTDAGPWEAARIAGLAVDKMTALSPGARSADGPGVTVTLAQYFQQALPTKSITVVPGKGEHSAIAAEPVSLVPHDPQ